MTITTADQLEKGLESTFSRFSVNKASVTANATAGEFFSLWRATGVPAQAAIPTTTTSVPNSTTLGAISPREITVPSTTTKAYLTDLSFVTGATTPQSTIEIHDRLLHMGGLSGNSTAVQTITSMDLFTFSGTNNFDNRMGPNLENVQWWLEWYTDTGATAANITVNCTFNDGLTANLTAVTFGRRAGRMISLNSLIPAAKSGFYITNINSVQLTAATGTAGSFGITATRYLCSIRAPELNLAAYADWTNIGLPEVYYDSCLFPILLISPGTNGTAGTVALDGKIIYG